MTITVDLLVFWASMIFVLGVVWVISEIAVSKILNSPNEDFDVHVSTTPGMNHPS